MRILITGGAGFIGSHMVDRLIAEGHRVVAMDNLVTGDLVNIAHHGSNPNFEFIHHNVSNHIHVAGDLDWVLHFASPASPIDYLQLPIQTLKVGALGTHNALGLAKAKDAKFLLTSTSEVYGDPLVHPQHEEYWGNVNPIGVRGCFSADTEILTKDGWKLFPRLTDRDEVLTLTPDGSMEYHRSVEIIKQRYIGELIRFTNTKIDLLVTPNHKMLVRERDQPDFRLVEAYQDITWEKSEMLKSGEWVGEQNKNFCLPLVPNAKAPQQTSIPMDLWLEFFGYFITEGSTYCRQRNSVINGKTYENKQYVVLISQSQKHPMQRAKIRNCLERLGFNFHEEQAQFRITSKQLFTYLRQFGKAKQKHIPREFLQLPPRQLQILLDAMILGDGGNDGRRFYPSSSALIDATQEILLKLGMAGSIHRKGEGRPAHAIHILTNGSKDFLTPKYPRRSIEWYDGYVYCVNVPNHIIYVRRNQKAVWCGNCYDEAKRFAEAVTMAYHRVHKVDVRIVRIFNCFGPRNRVNDGRVVPTFINQALHGEPLTVFGKGSQTRSFQYVDDLIEGIRRLMDAQFNKPVNIGNPNEMTILEFAKLILRLTGSRSEIEYRPLPVDDPKTRRPDITRAKEVLGWEPRVPVEEGLKKTIEWYRSKES